MSAHTLDLFANAPEEFGLVGQTVTDHAPHLAARLAAQSAALDLDARQIPLPGTEADDDEADDDDSEEPIEFDDYERDEDLDTSGNYPDSDLWDDLT
jgi:hypothetical protein